MRNVGNSNGARARVRGVGEIEKKKQNKTKKKNIFSWFLFFLIFECFFPPPAVLNPAAARGRGEASRRHP
jgi:hypothetical protein